jgi:hypothetical protein
MNSNPPSEQMRGPVPGTIRPKRHALGLPAGSIRAILTLLVVGMMCILLLLSPHKGKAIPIPPYLLYLLFLGVGHFFAAHGTSISRKGTGEPAPLFLPGGFIRLLIVGILAATVAWKFTKGYDDFQAQLTASMQEIPQQPFLAVILLTGFFLGVILHMLVGWEHPPYWFQDFEAWVALVAVFGLAIDAMIYLVINPTLDNPLDSYELQGFIAAAIAFYFGARS